MSETHAQFVGSVPEHYDRHLGPVIFEPYADDLARRVAATDAPGAVLEIACGTGIVTRHLRRALPASRRLVASDLNTPMLEYAAGKASGAIEWKQADAGALPFQTEEFGAVACQFGLMFVPDKPAAFREARRVLKPCGAFVFSVWDSFAHNPYARIAHAVIGGFCPADPPRFYEVPFGFHDRDILTALLEDSRFDRIAIETVNFPAVSESALSFATGLVRGNPVGAELDTRGVALDAVIEAVAMALRAEGGDRPFRSRMQALVATARARA